MNSSDGSKLATKIQKQIQAMRTKLHSNFGAQNSVFEFRKNLSELELDLGILEKQVSGQQNDNSVFFARKLRTDFNSIKEEFGKTETGFDGSGNTRLKNRQTVEVGGQVRKEMAEYDEAEAMREGLSEMRSVIVGSRVLQATILISFLLIVFYLL